MEIGVNTKGLGIAWLLYVLPSRIYICIVCYLSSRFQGFSLNSSICMHCTIHAAALFPNLQKSHRNA